MKFALIASIFLLSLANTVPAAVPEAVTVRFGHEVKAAGGDLKIKFVRVLEDSRCPAGTNCIWAGNAKVKIQIAGKRGMKTFELNTNTGPKGDSIEGWSIMLDSLTPAPQAGRKINPRSYRATFSVTRLTR